MCGGAGVMRHDVLLFLNVEFECVLDNVANAIHSFAIRVRVKKFEV